MDDKDILEGFVCENLNLPRRGERNSGRAYRRRCERIKYDRQKQIIRSGGYLAGRGYFPWDDESHIKYYSNSDQKRWLKQQSNRAIRRSKEPIPKGWGCHKTYEYWWNLD